MFVLKPNDDYGGHGVYFGAQLDEREWEQRDRNGAFSRLHRAGCARFAPGSISNLQRDRLEAATDVRRYEPISLSRQSLRCDGSSIRHANR